MCGRVNIRGTVYRPHRSFTYTTLNNLPTGMWGIGSAYNARIEGVNSTWKWILNNRGVFIVNGFYEQNKYVTCDYGRTLALGVLYDDNFNFAVITRASQPSLLSIHHRQPLIIEDIDEWLSRGTFDPNKETELLIR